MKFTAQHNNRKIHLVSNNKPMCGYTGVLNFTQLDEMIFKEGFFYEIYSGKIESKIEDESAFCKKCLDKIRLI